jgi:aminoacylase
MKLNFLTTEEELAALECFSTALRFQTISGLGVINGEYEKMATWLMNELTDSGVEDVQIISESMHGKPIVVGCIPGQNPKLSQLLLNAHYDVVPIVSSDWTVPPFDGMRKDGRIYGRGAQDMKCVVASYICAVRKLIKMKFSPLRTIYLSFVPDEEVGGREGMQVFLESAWFRSKNIGLALDEGLASEDDCYSVFYGERLPWWIKVHAKGNTGHASRFIEDTAVSSIVEVVNRALTFRESQRRKLHGNSCGAGCSHSVAKKLGDVTSLNVTLLRAGMRAGEKDVLNVVPATAEAGFDIRISPSQPPMEISNMLDTWCNEVGSTSESCKISWSYENTSLNVHYTTELTDENQWWKVFRDVLCNECGISCRTEVFPAATDSRFLRAMGIKAFGFSPIRRSPILLHENDEYLEEKVYIEGVNVYIKLIDSLSQHKEL